MKNNLNEMRTEADRLLKLAQYMMQACPCRPLAMAVTSLEMAKAWQGKLLEALGVASPYGSGYKKPADIVATADVAEGNVVDAYVQWKDRKGNNHKGTFCDLSRIQQTEYMRESISALLDRFTGAEQSLSGKKNVVRAADNAYQHLCEARMNLGFEFQRIREESEFQKQMESEVNQQDQEDISNFRAANPDWENKTDEAVLVEIARRLAERNQLQQEYPDQLDQFKSQYPLTEAEAFPVKGLTEGGKMLSLEEALEGKKAGAMSKQVQEMYPKEEGAPIDIHGLTASKEYREKHQQTEPNYNINEEKLVKKLMDPMENSESLIKEKKPLGTTEPMNPGKEEKPTRKTTKKK